MPHFADKDIVRRAMKGHLPDEVRLRPKRPFGIDPAEVLLRRDPAPWLPLLGLPQMAPFVDPRILSRSLHTGLREARPLQQELKALCLAKWLTYR